MRPVIRRPTATAQRGLLVLFFLFLLLAPTADAVTPRVLASTYRVDLGDVAPGETREGTFMLSNPTSDTVRVHFGPDGDKGYVVLPPFVDVPPGGATEVRYQYEVPINASPGHHGEAIRLLAGAATAAPGVGTLDAATAMLFTSRTRAVGVTAIEGPALALPGETVAGRVIVVNTDNVSALVSVRLQWIDAKGSAVTERRIPAQTIAASGTVAFAYNMSATTAAAGVQTLRATPVEEPNSVAKVSANMMEHTFLQGIRSASATIGKIADRRDGNATVDFEIVNTGTVPITFRPRVSFRGVSGTFEVLLDPVTLQPGERRSLSTIIELPPGRFSAFVFDENDDAIELASLGRDDASFDMRPVARSFDVGGLVILGVLLLGVLALVIVLVWVARRRGLALVAAWTAWRARPRRVRAAPPTAAPNEEDGMGLFLAALELEEARPISHPVALDLTTPVTVFVDLESLGTKVDRDALFRLVGGGREIVGARAYARAGSVEEAARVYYELARDGFAPRVGSQSDFRVDLTVDAIQEARQGRVVILVTHDLAFATLARWLRADGTRVEVAGIGWKIPVALREEADAIHDLAPRHGLQDRSAPDRGVAGRPIPL